MDLTLSLLALGVAMFAAMAAHAWWKARRESELRRPFAPTISDGQRLEPELDPVDDGLPPAIAQGPEIGTLRSLRRPVRLDALIDAIATVSLEAPVTGELAVAHLPASNRAGTKPMLVEGLDTETGTWETPTHGRRYTEFQAGVQLAHRAGPLNEIEYSEFVQKVQAFADGVGATADIPDMLDVVARARELDAFASEADAQLTLQLRANGAPWSVGYLQQMASRHGFVPGALPGRLVMPGPADGDPPALVLSFDPQAALAEGRQPALQQVTLTLEVAQTPQSAEPFPAWHRAATALSADMDATAVDEKGVPVTLHDFDTIGRELSLLYRRLESRDLAAGSAAARRLFS